MRSEVVPRFVKGQILYSVDFTQLGNEFLQLLVGTYRQQPVIGTFGPILFDNPQRYVQQPHNRFRAGLLSSYANPLLAVLRPLDMVGR